MTARTYFVDLCTDGRNGFMCYCYNGAVRMCARFFATYADADTYGDEWVYPIVANKFG